MMHVFSKLNFFRQSFLWQAESYGTQEMLDMATRVPLLCGPHHQLFLCLVHLITRVCSFSTVMANGLA